VHEQDSLEAVVKVAGMLAVRQMRMQAAKVFMNHLSMVRRIDVGDRRPARGVARLSRGGVLSGKCFFRVSKMKP
jgi:hypothetical protein